MILLAEWTGLEPATPGVTGRYSASNLGRVPKLTGGRADVRQVLQLSDARCSRPAAYGGQASQQSKRERLQKEAADLRRWLAEHPEDRHGSKGTARKSNRTDNDSAKMATSKGVIQDYTGVAAVDSQHQIIVEAQAHGTGSEHELLIPVVDAMANTLAEDSLITADAGYHSENNLTALAERDIDALLTDNNMRSRDERFATQERHKGKPDPLANKSKDAKKPKLYQIKDFRYDPPDAHLRLPRRQDTVSLGDRYQLQRLRRCAVWRRAARLQTM